MVLTSKMETDECTSKG